MTEEKQNSMFPDDDTVDITVMTGEKQYSIRHDDNTGDIIVMTEGKQYIIRHLPIKKDGNFYYYNASCTITDSLGNHSLSEIRTTELTRLLNWIQLQIPKYIN